MLNAEQREALKATVILMTGDPSMEATVVALMSILNEEVRDAGHAAGLIYKTMSPEMRRTMRGFLNVAQDECPASAFQWAGWTHDHMIDEYVFPKQLKIGAP